MKKTYARRQIAEAIKHWESFLAANCAVDQILSRPDLLAEAEAGEEEYDREKVKAEVQKCAKSPEKLGSYLEANEQRFQKALSRASEKEKPALRRAWSNLKHASKRGPGFIEKHKAKILALVAVVAAGMLSYPLFKKNWGKVQSILTKPAPAPSSQNEPASGQKDGQAVGESPSQKEPEVRSLLLGKPRYPINFMYQLFKHPEKIKFLSTQQRSNLEYLSKHPEIQREMLESLARKFMENRNRMLCSPDGLKHSQQDLLEFLQMCGKSNEEFKRFLNSRYAGGDDQFSSRALRLPFQPDGDSDSLGVKADAPVFKFEKAVVDAIEIRQEVDLDSSQMPPEIRKLSQENKRTLSQWLDGADVVRVAARPNSLGRSSGYSLSNPKQFSFEEDYPGLVRSRCNALKEVIRMREKTGLGNETAVYADPSSSQRGKLTGNEIAINQYLYKLQMIYSAALAAEKATGSPQLAPVQPLLHQQSSQDDSTRYDVSKGGLVNTIAADLKQKYSIDLSDSEKEKLMKMCTNRDQKNSAYLSGGKLLDFLKQNWENRDPATLKKIQQDLKNTEFSYTDTIEISQDSGTFSTLPIQLKPESPKPEQQSKFQDQDFFSKISKMLAFNPSNASEKSSS